MRVSARWSSGHPERVIRYSNPIHFAASAVAICTLLATALPTHAFKTTASVSTSDISTGSESTADIERRLLPYFEARAGRKKPPRGVRPASPTTADLLFLARSWDDLSASFRDAYQAAIDIPAGMLRYPTPGGNCEIIYVTTGLNRVDTTDTYGYSRSEWRVRTTGPNGVPDYIDEVAFGCDSAWSMEVDGFGFNPPYPYTSSSYPSSLYKVVVLNLDSVLVDGDTVQIGRGLYGQTFPGGPAPDVPTGFVSRFELRNNWNGPLWRNVSGNNYETHPEWAVHVTCVHEFFHGVQYAMARRVVQNVYIDDFPLSWLEGTAVLMEETGFGEVNDFIQYSSSYFSRPYEPVISQYTYGYHSAILAIFLYEFAPPAREAISLIRQTFVNSHRMTIPFLTNLNVSADSAQWNWRTALGEFHSRSFFSGARSRPGMFVKDAALLPSWSYIQRTADQGVQTTQVSPSSLRSFHRPRSPADTDTMTIYADLTRSGAYDTSWYASVVLRSRSSPRWDTRVLLPLSGVGPDTLKIENWHSYEEALVVLSNTHFSVSGNAILSFNKPIPPPIPASLAVYPNPVRLSSAAPVIVAAPGLRSVRIYSFNGNLVKTIMPAVDSSRAYWDVSRASASVLPGTYFAVIEQKQPEQKATTERRKILVLP